MADVNENRPIGEIPLIQNLTGATILGTDAAGKASRFPATSISGTALGIADASTVPLVGATTGQYYDATPGVTYPNFGNIAIPLTESGNTIYNAKLVKQGNGWVAKYDRMSADQLGNVAKVKGATDSLEGVFLVSKSLDLGLATAGRYTNAFTQDTNSSYKKTDFIPVAPEWILTIATSQSSNCFSVEFDQFQQPLRTMSWTAGQPYTLHPNARFVRFSQLGSASTPVSYNVQVTSAISSSFRGVTTKVMEGETTITPKSDNVFNWRTIIHNASLGSTGGLIYNAATYKTTPLIPITETGAYVVNPVVNTINSWRLASYDANGVFIAYEGIAGANTLVDQMLGRYAQFSPATVPSNARYVRFCFDFRAENTQEQLESISLIPLKAWRSLLNNRKLSGTISSSDVRNLIKVDRVINNDITNLRVLKLGDSITANLMSAGSWNIWFNGALGPFSVNSYATGGATLSSTEPYFGDQYRTSGGNTFMRQCEAAYYGISNGTIPMPDIFMIMGGTNDFDVGRHVTPAEQGSTDYDEYMEQTFFTQSPGYNTLIPLENVNRGKVAGALRYIVERLGTIAPNAIFIICTPIQSTLHNQLNARRTVRDIRWAAERLNIPLIDQWRSAGMPMLWDYGDNRRFLGDRIHPFTDTGQTRGSAVMGRFVTNEFLKLFIPNV